MSTRTNEIQEVWESRSKALGNTKRSVLLKNIPDFINNTIHQQHLEFINSSMESTHKNILDVGCGYGRISQELLNKNHDLCIEGVELSSNFSEYFSKNIGKCYNMPLQNFKPNKKYDVILIITMLMYIDSKEEIETVLSKLLSALNKNGKIICIEPAENILTTLRKYTKFKKFEPTGKEVKYYKKYELAETFKQLQQVKIEKEGTIGLLPCIGLPIIHRAITISHK